MTPEESDPRRTLAAVAMELAGDVAVLAKASKDQADALEKLAGEVKHKTGKTTVKIRWMVALVALCLILSGAVLVGYVRIRDLVENQEVVKGQVLCPMYKIFLGSYQPETRTPGPDRDKYEATFKDMWTQYGALNCTGALVPPRYDLPHPPKPTALAPLGSLLSPPLSSLPVPAAVSVTTPPSSKPAGLRRATQRRVTRRVTTTTAKSSVKSSGGKSNGLIGSVAKALPKPKVDVGGDVKLGPVKARVRLHIP